MRIQSQYNYKECPGESGFGLSITIPGQSYSVKEALARIQKGLTVSGRSYAYQEDNETEPPMRLRDLTDLDNAKLQLRQLKKEQNDAVKKIKEAAEKKAAQIPPGEVPPGG